MCCSVPAASKVQLSGEHPSPLFKWRPFLCTENNAKIHSPKRVGTGSSQVLSCIYQPLGT